MQLEQLRCVEGYGWLTHAACALRHDRVRALRGKPAIDLPADLRHCRDCAVGAAVARDGTVPLVTTRWVDAEPRHESPREDRCAECRHAFIRVHPRQRYCKPCREPRELQRLGGGV